MLVADCGESLVRSYAIYVSETQEQADKHVAAVATLFERRGLERAVNKYGSSKGWRRNRLSLDNGFTVDALGLDTAARGIKLDENRPGLMVFDDLDGKHDTPKTTKKKIEILTDTLLPAQSENCAILFVQNLIHRNSIASRLADGRADFLIDRVVSGPFPAVENLETASLWDATLQKNRNVIVSGFATWAGQSLEACQKAIDTYGLASFVRESQQEVFNTAGALFNRNWFEIVDSVPRVARRVRRWDEAATEGGGDWTVGLLMAKVGGTFYVEDIKRFQHHPGTRDRLIRETAIADDAKYGSGHVRVLGVQDPGSAGVTAAKAFRDNLRGFVVDIERETGSKKKRAEDVAGDSKDGNVKVLRAAWNDDFFDEIEAFTGEEEGETDDQVDTLSGAYNKLKRVAVLGE